VPSGSSSSNGVDSVRSYRGVPIPMASGENPGAKCRDVLSPSSLVRSLSVKVDSPHAQLS
jgi:hypothetical protein